LTQLRLLLTLEVRILHLRGGPSTKSKSKYTLLIYNLSLWKYPSNPSFHLTKYNLMIVMVILSALEVSHLLLGILLKEATGAP
jgi:hypothetical protein